MTFSILSLIMLHKEYCDVYLKLTGFVCGLVLEFVLRRNIGNIQLVKIKQSTLIKLEHYTCTKIQS